MKITTKTDNLPSGIEIEFEKLTGKHQRLLTEKGHNSDDFISSFIVRIGSERNITPETVKNMIAPDRKMALIFARQYALNNDPILKLNIPYRNESGRKLIAREQINLDELGGFPVVKPKRIENGEIVEANYTELSEIQKEFEIILPESEMKVRWCMLDGVGEKWAAKLNRNQRSSHTPIQMRFPKEIRKDSNGKDLPIVLNLDNLTFKDIEVLREHIYDIEGRVDSEYMYEHPETGAEETIDILSTPTFYFPSGKI